MLPLPLPRFFFTLLLIATHAVSYKAQAQIPRTLSYQAVLTDNEGTPKPDGPYTVTFRLYAAANGGVPLWTESQVLQVKNAIFSAVLGSVTPIGPTLTFTQPYWMSLQVAPEPELPSRLPLTAAGYALGPWTTTSTGVSYNTSGNVGIGTSTPAHRLGVAGGPFWTANQWLGAVEFPNGAALGWQANQAGQRFGMGHSSGGFYMFRTASDPGTAGSPALYDFMVNDAGNVGIGTTTPSARLQVNGNWNGEQGALQLSGHRPTLRFTGNADSGNESWLLHLGDDGPLGFYRRTGPAAWSPVMQLTTSGRQMEIYGQDALGLIGFQPFLTLFDGSAGNARGRIQSASGGIFLQPESYINGSNPGAAVVIANSGFVGIGTTSPVAKMHAETPLPNTAAVYGKATGSGGVGVYGQSVLGAAVHAEGNAIQQRDKGGFVKAMAFIDPFLPAAQYVVRCYNSQQAGSAVSTAPCGITVTRVFTGNYIINFGFNVQDRFISVSPHEGPVMVAAYSFSSHPNRADVSSWDGSNAPADASFTIFVY